MLQYNKMVKLLKVGSYTYFKYVYSFGNVWDGSWHKVRTYKEYHSVALRGNWDSPPTPHPQASVPPPPCFWGEGNTRWRERGWGGVPSPNSDEGLHCGTLYMYVLCGSWNGGCGVCGVGRGGGGGVENYKKNYLVIFMGSGAPNGKN